jgi:hypothetical protein
MNNSYGIVKSQLEDGNLRLQTNSKNDMAVKPEFCKPIVQCMNRNQRNVPVLIHPKLKGESFPRVHWLHEAPKDIFPKKAFEVTLPENYLKDKKLVSHFSNYPSKLVGKEESTKTIDYLTKTLDWQQPTLLAFIEIPQKAFIIWYDKKSTAKINKVINTHVNSAEYHDVEIRGPVVYFDYCKMLEDLNGETSINPMMAIMLAQVEVVENPGLVCREPNRTKKSTDPMTDKLVELKYITREHQVRDEQNARYRKLSLTKKSNLDIIFLNF